MAVKICCTPASIVCPEFSDFSTDYKAYNVACEKYVKATQEWAKANGSSECAGEIIFFGVGDGAARYVVFSLKPVQLIHLADGDSYQFPYAHLLTAKAVREIVRRNKAIW
jgi:hypothetical protein